MNKKLILTTLLGGALLAGAASFAQTPDAAPATMADAPMSAASLDQRQI